MISGSRKDKFAPFNCGEYFGVILFEKTVHLLFIYITISRGRLDFATIFPRCKIKFYRWPVMVIVIRQVQFGEKQPQEESCFNCSL